MQPHLPHKSLVSIWWQLSSCVSLHPPFSRLGLLWVPSRYILLSLLPQCSSLLYLLTLCLIDSFPQHFIMKIFTDSVKFTDLCNEDPETMKCIFLKCSIEWAYQFIHLCSPNPLSGPWNSITTKHYALCLFFGNPDLQHHPKRQLFFPIWNESSVDVVSALWISVKSRWLMVVRSLMTSLSCIHLIVSINYWERCAVIST